MNASAVLTRQGWRGEGHALDRAGRGVRKPILIRRKNDILGVGKKKIDVQADQWWARAFDAALSGVNPGSSTAAKSGTEEGTTDGKGKGEGGVKEERISDLHLLAAGGSKWSGLYAGFVKGGRLEGTIGVVDAKTGLDSKAESKRELESAIPDSENVKTEGVKKKKKHKKTRDDQVPTTASLNLLDAIGSVKHEKHKEKKKKHKKSRDVGEAEDQAMSSEMLADETVSAITRQSSEKPVGKESSGMVAEPSSTKTDRLIKKKRKRKHKDRDSGAD